MRLIAWGGGKRKPRCLVCGAEVEVGDRYIFEAVIEHQEGCHPALFELDHQQWQMRMKTCEDCGQVFEEEMECVMHKMEAHPEEDG